MESERQQRIELDRKVQRRILELFDEQRRANPGQGLLCVQIDVEQLCKELDIDHTIYTLNAKRLVDQGKIKQPPWAGSHIEEGNGIITESGIQALEVATTHRPPQRDAQEAWNEVAKLRRRVQIAERSLPSLIKDQELRQRCVDLLEASGNYDRVIREACVVLEDRVRTEANLDNNIYGAKLMVQAFGQNAPRLIFSNENSEQQGAMNIYHGIMGFFRNAAGHRVVPDFSQEDALRFVAFIDLLLDMVAKAQKSP
jgi:uncharacterized protein (TIGR02391 family)